MKHWIATYNERKYYLWLERSGNKLMWDFMNDTYLKSCKRNRAEVKFFYANVCQSGRHMDAAWAWFHGSCCWDYHHYIQDSFKEHNLKPKVGKILNDAGEQVDEYSSPDRRLVLFAGDLLNITADDLPFAKFDIICVEFVRQRWLRMEFTWWMSESTIRKSMEGRAGLWH